MKFSDLRRLACISIDTKEKSTKNTIRGIILGLAILVPVMFFAFSFNYGLNKEVDKVKTLASFNIISKFDESSPSSLPSSDIINRISNINGVESVVNGEYFIFDTEQNSRIDINIYSNSNGNFFNFNFTLGNNRINPTIKVCDVNYPLFTDSEYSDILNQGASSSPYRAGFGFSGDGVGQIIISESILKFYGINPLEAIGARIWIAYLGQQTNDIDVDENPENPYDVKSKNPVYFEILNNYEIVGVLKEEFLGLPSRINESHIWISDASIKNNDGYILPIMRNHIVEEKKVPVYTYNNPDVELYSLSIAQSGKVFLPIGYGVNYSYNVDQSVYHERIRSTIVQCDSFSRALAIEGKITDEYRKVDMINYIPDQNPLYQQVRTISTIATYVLLVLVVFALIILITTLLNLFNTINYSVDSRRHYIGVMKAIGAKKKTIVNMYFMELLILLSRTVVWVLSIGGIISIIIKYIVDEGLEKFKDVIPYEFRLNLWYFPLAFILVIVFDFIIAFLFSHMACVKTNSKSILEILKDER